MSSADHRKQDTKGRLIEAAAAVFAEMDYRDATVAEICRRAGANIAAVTYHFGGKERLYEAVWQQLVEAVDRRYPTALTGTAADTIRLIVQQRVSAIFDPGPAGWLPRILHRQMVRPAPETDRLVKKYLAPRLQKLEDSVAEVAALPAAATAVRYCAMSLQSQLVFLNLCRRGRERIFAGREPTPAELAALIEHIVQFTMAGIAAISRNHVRT